MDKISVIRYTPDRRAEWDSFVASARNATFLFLRDYMDYHADRFSDCSWLAYKGSRLAAVLPADITDDATLHSHRGLTYGGWVLPTRHIDGGDLLHIFNEAIAVWRNEGIRALDYKSMPQIYCSSPSQEDEYALFRLGARLSECNLSETIPLGARLRQGVNSDSAVSDTNSALPQDFYNKLRRRALTKCSQLDFRICETDNAEPLMHLVEQCLSERHSATPVHTTAEMQLLKDRFPHNIRFHLLEYAGSPQAAVCIFDTGRVAHAQYIATTPTARELNLLTPLFHTLITHTYASREYFDFGTSNENHGLVLNEGLLRQKASFGATGTACNRYLLSL